MELDNKFETVTVFGIPISKMNMRQTVRYLTEAVHERNAHHVVTANPIMVMEGLQNPSFMAMLKNADMVVPDGAGLVWAASRVGKPVAERVAGFDLVQELFKVGNEEGWRVFFLGASQENIEAARDNMAVKYPGLRFVGCRNGYFGPDEDDSVVKEIVEAAPDLLLVGRSMSTQDVWITKYKDRLKVPVMIGVGGSFDVMSGRIKRAPKWMRAVKLEWLYRLAQEPSRLPRMTVLPKFALKVLLKGENIR
ncbi:WecB/TagA/CpsF family glycosyltransferase [Paenibacillus thermotolerans]|uniref:WecB/TagA/CpsF family glycosyltransferase n=1 Tax=Paenibacillus thermotolerans TaxID=3027807 RepID=UPI002368EF8A|nr:MULTISPECIES: WecB/TagA/CpsF family glycosyltransferase [unclassified Paenibacillus]